jgi:23S rRNA maturation mini-RNase III
MGEYDKEKKQFTKRSKGTVKPFPDLNREALAYVLDAIQKKYQKQVPNLKDLSPEEQQEFERLLQSENFAKLYAWAIEKVTPATKESLENTQGEWVKYDRNSDHMPLVQSLQGHGTGWCTAGESTAQAQLQAGDFYVYYSLDAQGSPTIPRVAIRMQENGIAEVRGIASDQNLDPYIGDVVKAKLSEFPDGKAYEQKSEDMKRLTEIDNKVKANEELTQEELRFIYELDHKIQGFGYVRDPRINEIIDNRDIKSDISLITGYPKEQVSIEKEEVFLDGIKTRINMFITAIIAPILKIFELPSCSQ